MPAERTLHLLLPGLAWPDVRDARPYADLALPALGRVLGRGEVAPLTVATAAEWLAGQYGYATSAAFGALAALGANISTQRAGWLSADPVHLRAHSAELFLVRGEDLAITEEEAAACLAALNGLFDEDGLHFRALSPHRWITDLDAPPALVTAPPARVHGRSIDALLPGGPDARIWLSRMNEAQMLLHGLPLNEARELRGRPTINSLWFWGSGVYAAPDAQPFAHIFATHPEALGCARAGGATPHDVVATPSAAIDATADGAVLCWLDDGVDAAARGLEDDWRAAMETFDRGFLTPVLDALKRGRIDALEIVVPAGRGGFTARVGRGGLRKFWRRAGSLAGVARASGER